MDGFNRSRVIKITIDIIRDKEPTVLTQYRWHSFFHLLIRILRVFPTINLKVTDSTEQQLNRKLLSWVLNQLPKKQFKKL